MQSTEKGDVALSVTLDTSGLRKETDKIKSELQQALRQKSQDTELEFHANTRDVEDATKELESLSSAASVAANEINNLSQVSENMRNIAMAALEAASGMDDARRKADFTQVAESLWDAADKVDVLSDSMKNVSDASQIAENIQAVQTSASDLVTLVDAVAQGMNDVANASNSINDLSSIGAEANNLAHSMSEIEGIASALADASASTDNMAAEADDLAGAMEDVSDSTKQAASESNLLAKQLAAMDDLAGALVELETLRGLPDALSDLAESLRNLSNIDPTKNIRSGADEAKKDLDELKNAAGSTYESLERVKQLFTNGDSSIESINEFTQAYDRLSDVDKKLFDEWKNSLHQVKKGTEDVASATEEVDDSLKATTVSLEQVADRADTSWQQTAYKTIIDRGLGEEFALQFAEYAAENGKQAAMVFLEEYVNTLKQNSNEATKSFENEPLHYEFRLDVPEDETFTEQLNRMKEEAKSAQEELNKLTSGFKYSNEYEQVTEDVNAVQKELMSANQKLADMERLGQSGTKEYDELADKAFQLEKVLEDAKAVQQDIVDDGKKYTIGVDEQAIQNTQSRVDALIKKISLLQQNIRMGGDAWKQLTPNDKFSVFVAKLKTEYKELGDVILKKAVPAIQKFASNMVKAAGSAVKGGVASLTASFKKLTPQVNASNKSLAAGLKQILGYTVGISSLLMLFNKLRGAITEGIRNLAQWRDGNNKVNENLSVFISSLLQLKNQLAGAFAPIINTVVPILNTFIDSLIEAGNYLAQFIAKITGQDTWIKATRVQKNYADSLKGTGKSAKDAAGALARFDDLDVLNKKNVGGEGGIDPNDMFEEMPIEDVEENVEGWVEKLKIAWDNSDFTDIGATIGQNLKTMLDEIPWADIQEKARKIAHSVATLLNGFFETEGLADSIGRTLAEVFRTVFVFVDEFVHTLHWDSIGTFIGEALVSFVTDFPWEEAGSALGGLLVGVITLAYNTVKTFVDENGFTTLYTGILDSIDKFLEEMNKKPGGKNKGLNGWEKLGETIYMALNGVLTSMTELVENLPIDEIMEGLSKVGEKAQVSQLVKSFFGLAEAIIQAIAKALKLVDASAVGEALGWVLNGIIDLGDDLLALAGVILDKIAEALKSGYSTLSSEHPLVVALGIAIGAALVAMKTGVIPAAGIANISTILSGLLGTLTVGVGKIILVVAAWEFGFNVGKAIGEALNKDDKQWYVDFQWKDFINPDGFKATMKDLGAGFTLMTNEWFSWIDEGAYKIFGFFDKVVDDCANFVWNVGNAIGEGVDNIVYGFVDGLNRMGSWLKQQWDAFWENVISWFKDVFGIHSPSTVFASMGADIIQGLINGVKGLLDKVIEIWENIKSAIVEKVIAMKDNIMLKIDAFKLTFLGAFAEIKSKFVSIWDKIKEGIKKPINAIIGLIEGMVNKIIDGINGLIEKANAFSKGFKFTNPFTKEQVDIGFQMGTLNHISIPRLAQGAVIPPNREFMAVLGDQRQGTNIEAPLDTITQAFADVVGSIPTGSTNAVMQLDGQTFARLLVPYVVNEMGRRGYNVKVLEG